MESRWLKIVFTVLTLLSVYVIDAGAASGPQASRNNIVESCEPSKRPGLAMDQRDDSRMECLKKKKTQLSATQCLAMAKKMEYSNNAEEARMICLYDLNKLSAKDCATVAKNMEYADSGDEARWHCIREFNKSISKKQCEKLAKAMAYPPNTERGLMYCENELN
ncbi:hypothetical protein [Bdellovibrio sp. HCB209]|uniref:hypothetical protein n=1 Tax=Bdellovibrio sp. HCB209 TaxID=3394354 RepID=UPI0039B6241D